MTASLLFCAYIDDLYLMFFESSVQFRRMLEQVTGLNMRLIPRLRSDFHNNIGIIIATIASCARANKSTSKGDIFPQYERYNYRFHYLETSIRVGVFHGINTTTGGCQLFMPQSGLSKILEKDRYGAVFGLLLGVDKLYTLAETPKDSITGTLWNDQFGGDPETFKSMGIYSEEFMRFVFESLTGQSPLEADVRDAFEPEPQSYIA